MTLALVACAARADPIPLLDVDVELVLCVDSSESIDSDEFALQRQGIALAFQSEEIVNAIQRGALGRIAVSLVDFADDASVRVPFVVISDTKSAVRFAAMVLASEREKNGDTSISAGIWTSVMDLNAAPYRATRRVIDVSGDGANNRDNPERDINMTTAGELARTNHVVVNGLPIESDELGVVKFYQESVLTGTAPSWWWPKVLPISDVRSGVNSSVRFRDRVVSNGMCDSGTVGTLVTHHVQ